VRRRRGGRKLGRQKEEWEEEIDRGKRFRGEKMKKERR